MTAGLLIATPSTRQAVLGGSPDILPNIYKDSVNMVVWQRAPTATLSKECQTLLTGKGLTSHRTTMSAAKIRNLDEKLPVLASSPHLRADIRLLAEMFSCLFGLRAIGLRLTTLTEPMCPRFHVDRVPCRLITTYVGNGTEWLPHQLVDRSKLGSGNGGLSDTASGLIPSEQQIQRLSPGDVALFKGELWEGNEGAGVVHRSPPADCSQQRLLLSIDFV